MGRETHAVAWFGDICSYLWTTKAGCFAFLLVPAARGADEAGGQAVGNGGKDLYDARDETAVLAVEVAAFLLLAGSSETRSIIGYERLRRSS